MAERDMTELGDQSEGLLTQEDMDALLAAAGGAEEEYTLGEGTLGEGTLGEDDLEGDLGAEPAAGMVDLPLFGAAPPTAASAAIEPDGLGRVRDIPLEVTVELGRTRLLLRDIMDLAPGSIIELDKLAGEPVDLFANGMLIARGEVIVIDDNFGVRVTEIITAAERSGGDKAHARAA